MSSSDDGRPPGAPPKPGEPSPSSTLPGAPERGGRRATLPPPNAPRGVSSRDSSPRHPAPPAQPPAPVARPSKPASQTQIGGFGLPSSPPPGAPPNVGSGPVPQPLSGPTTTPHSGPAGHLSQPTQPYPGGIAPSTPEPSAPYPQPAPHPQSAPHPYPNPAPIDAAPAPYPGVASQPHSGGIPQPHGGAPHSDAFNYPHSAGQHSAGQHSAGQHSAGQHSAGQHSSGPYPGSGPMSPPTAGPPWAGGPQHAQGALHSVSSGLPPSAGDSLDEIPGSQFVSFLKISAKRAFRLRIDPSEVLPAERRSLQNASPPIVDPNLQAFLAWRRSVLFLVACALIPLALIGLIDAARSTQWKAIFFVKFAPALAEALFAWICWSQLKKWAHWRTQRRKLFWGWLLFMLTPFIVFIYPLNTFFTELRGVGSSAAKREAMLALGIDGIYKQAVMPFVFSMLAMLQLAPKAISLMPGLIRASMVIKLLFPGASAPGWLIVMSAPMYALLAYVVLIIPYQFTGSGWFIAGVLGVVAAQSVLANAGFKLARPLSEAEALRQIKKVRTYYVVVMVVSGLLIVVALGSLVTKLNLRATDVILAVLKFETNVMLLTMIGADLVVTNLDKARNYTHGTDHIEDATENKIAAFVSFESPPPPPPGPPM